jgi:hypothetical protein
MHPDAADDLAIREHVVVLILPLAGGAGELAALADEDGHFGGPCVISFTTRSSALATNLMPKKDFGSTRPRSDIMTTTDHELTPEQLEPVSGGCLAAIPALIGLFDLGLAIGTGGVSPTGVTGAMETLLNNPGLMPK